MPKRSTAGKTLDGILKSIESDAIGCHIWPGPISGDRPAFKGEIVTRIILTRKLKRPIKPKHWALHTCDRPLCVNPDHLYEGTPQNNIRDWMRRNESWLWR